jgi:NAD(P)H-flavin reductase
MDLHEGEIEIRKRLDVPVESIPYYNGPYLPNRYLQFFCDEIEFLPVGYMLGDQVWVSIITGEPGYIQPMAQNILVMTPDNIASDNPLYQAMMSDMNKIPMAAVGVIHSNRRRNKLYGYTKQGARKLVDNKLAFCFFVSDMLGNCPKYITRRNVTLSLREPKIISRSSLTLHDDSVRLITSADVFYIGSIFKDEMDVNSRGGKPGFVRVSKDCKTIIYPEYSGNRLYQSLGNIQGDGRVGLCFPDFETGDVVQVTGTAKILIGEEARRIMPKAKVIVTVSVNTCIYIKDGLGLTAKTLELSPYDPPVYFLAEEELEKKGEDAISANIMAITTEKLTPNFTRTTFESSSPLTWKPGQYAVFDFSKDLNMGYRHMNDSDPSSLNDDYIRTFTIASATKFQLVTKTKGPVTTSLRLMPGIEGAVTAVGGEFIVPKEGEIGFVAGGIGITPLLASLPATNVTLFWSLNRDDVDILKYYDLSGLKDCHVFITGKAGADTSRETAATNRLPERVHFHYRRLEKADFRDFGHLTSWYVCASPQVKRLVGDIIEEVHKKQIVSEEFNY